VTALSLLEAAVIHNSRFLFADIYTHRKLHEQEAFSKRLTINLTIHDFDPCRKSLCMEVISIFFQHDLGLFPWFDKN